MHFTTVCLIVYILNQFLHFSIKASFLFSCPVYPPAFTLGLEALRNLEKTIHFERLHDNLLKVTIKTKYETISSVKTTMVLREWFWSKCQLPQQVYMYEWAAEFAFNTPLFITICKPSSYKLKWNAHFNVPLIFSLHLCILNMKTIYFTIWHILCKNGLSYPGCESEICGSGWKYH